MPTSSIIVRSHAESPHPVAPPPPRPSFDAVYAEHFAYVFHTLRRLGARPGELDDLVQELFIVVHRRLDEIDCSRPLKPWLFGIAFRVASEHRRRARLRPVGGPEALALADEGPSPEAHAADRQARALLVRALEVLDLDHRAVLVMHDIDEQPAPVVAEAMGVPLNTVYSRLRNARQKVAARVKRLRTFGGAR